VILGLSEQVGDPLLNPSGASAHDDNAYSDGAIAEASALLKAASSTTDTDKGDRSSGMGGGSSRGLPTTRRLAHLTQPCNTCG
jgi:hypothetical protein